MRRSLFLSNDNPPLKDRWVFPWVVEVTFIRWPLLDQCPERDRADLCVRRLPPMDSRKGFEVCGIVQKRVGTESFGGVEDDVLAG